MSQWEWEETTQNRMGGRKKNLAKDVLIAYVPIDIFHLFPSCLLFPFLVDMCRTGYDFLVFSRPELYDILLRQIPEDRISFNKRILSMRRSAGGTRIYCSDNSIYEGDIVIGADGAYSAVRQNMHKMMEADGVIAPDHDINDMAIPYMCMVGTTEPMDSDKYPQLKDSVNHLHHVVGANIHSVSFVVSLFASESWRLLWGGGGIVAIMNCLLCRDVEKRNHQRRSPHHLKRKKTKQNKEEQTEKSLTLLPKPSISTLPFLFTTTKNNSGQ